MVGRSNGALTNGGAAGTGTVSLIVPWEVREMALPTMENVPVSAIAAGALFVNGCPSAVPAAEIVTGTVTANAQVPSVFGVATPIAAPD